MKKAKIFLIILTLCLFIINVYAACTNPGLCRNSACCKESTGGMRPYFDGTVCTSKSQAHGTGDDCKYDGINNDSGIQIGGMCVAKEDAPDSTWNALAARTPAFSCPDNVEGARVPTINEFRQIDELFNANPIINSQIKFSPSDRYWSSSQNSSGGWAIDFSDRDSTVTSTRNKTQSLKVHCVK